MVVEYTYEDPSTGDEYEIRVGESAQENWDLITESAQNDLWFHLEKHSSPHVIIIVEDRKKIPKGVLKKAASYCHQHSKYHKMKNLSVIWTEIKNVTKADKVGSVYTKKTRKIKV